LFKSGGWLNTVIPTGEVIKTQPEPSVRTPWRILLGVNPSLKLSINQGFVAQWPDGGERSLELVKQPRRELGKTFYSVL